MGRARQFGSIAALVLLAGCANYPRDIAGTLDRVRATHRLRVGYAAIRPDDRALADAFLARIERVTGAKVAASTASAERQLALLEDGSLDLVLGEFAEDTPWLGAVAVIEPLTEQAAGQRRLGLAPVAANGENRWIMLLEHEVREMRAGRSG